MSFEIPMRGLPLAPVHQWLLLLLCRASVRLPRSSEGVLMEAPLFATCIILHAGCQPSSSSLLSFHDSVFIHRVVLCKQ